MNAIGSSLTIQSAQWSLSDPAYAGAATRTGTSVSATLRETQAGTALVQLLAVSETFTNVVPKPVTLPAAAGEASGTLVNGWQITSTNVQLTTNGGLRLLGISDGIPVFAMTPSPPVKLHIDVKV